jgi:IS4 transposase
MTESRTFEFISNLFEFRADTIAALYKLRWQINYYSNKSSKISTKIFLGDNENAIKIQIYCLDSKSFDRRDKEKFKRQWSFSNLVSFVEFIYSTIFI